MREISAASGLLWLFSFNLILLTFISKGAVDLSYTLTIKEDGLRVLGPLKTFKGLTEGQRFELTTC